MTILEHSQVTLSKTLAYWYQQVGSSPQLLGALLVLVGDRLNNVLQDGEICTWKSPVLI